MGANLDAALIEDRKPLIVQGMQVIPAGSSRFKTSDTPIMYFEVYEPLLLTADAKKPPAVAIQLRIVDRKTGEQKKDTGLARIEVPAETGNPVIPVGVRIPTESLAPGAYRLEVAAVDQAGKSFKRTADFEIE